MSYDCLLDFATCGPLIRHTGLGIRFLFVRLRFRYPFFSPVPRGTNLGSRYEVRRQLRPGGLSPQTDGMPVIPQKEAEFHLFVFCYFSSSARYAAASSISSSANTLKPAFLRYSTASPCPGILVSVKVPS